MRVDVIEFIGRWWLVNSFKVGRLMPCHVVPMSLLAAIKAFDPLYKPLV